MTVISDKRKLLLGTVCEAFEVTPDEMSGLSRKRHIVNARSVYSYLARHIIGDTLGQIGANLSRDHSTIHQQLDRMQALIYTRDQAAVIMKEIELELFQNKSL